jgi:hypothetical protein
MKRAFSRGVLKSTAILNPVLRMYGGVPQVRGWRFDVVRDEIHKAAKVDGFLPEWAK